MDRIGPYRLHGRIGDSGLWSGTDGRDGSSVMVRYPVGETEATVLSTIHHANLVPVLDVLSSPSGTAVVMPVASGGSLADVLAARGRVDDGDAAAIGVAIAGALAELHRAGIVHGDLSPANVLVDAPTTIWLADLGAARRVDESDSQLVGTAGYVAPELLHGAARSPASDVWALGRVIEVLVGSGLGHDLGELVRSACADHPGRRPSAAHFATSLAVLAPSTPLDLPERDEAAVAVGVRTRSFGPRPPRPRTPARGEHRQVVGVVAAALVVALLIVVGMVATGAA